MTKVAVIGLGIGKVHLQHYARNPHAEIVAVVDTEPARCDEIAAQFGVPGYATIADMLSRASVEAASICTPPACHAPQVDELAAAGVHVLVEKPMAPSMADCRRMIAAARESGVVLMVGQKKRFSSPYAFLKAKLDHEFGEPRWISIKYALGRVDKAWFWEEADGGGPLLENSIHVFDLVRFLMGEVETVYAHGGTLFRPDVAPQLDVAAISMGMANGGCVSIGCGYGSEWGFADERLSLATDSACCEVLGPFDRPNLMRYIRRDDPAHPIALDFDEPSGFEEEICEFLAAIHEHRQPSVTGEDASRSIAVALAVKQSIRERRIIRPAEVWGGRE